MDHLGKVATTVCGQLNRKHNISLSPFVPENLVSRDGFGSLVPRQPPHSQNSGGIWCLLRGFLPIFTAASIYLFKPPYAIGSVPRLSGHAIACRWCSLPRIHQHRASSLQGGSSNGCIDQLMCASFFRHLLLVLSGRVESIGGRHV